MRIVLQGDNCLVELANYVNPTANLQQNPARGACPLPPSLNGTPVVFWATPVTRRVWYLLRSIQSSIRVRDGPGTACPNTGCQLARGTGAIRERWLGVESGDPRPRWTSGGCGEDAADDRSGPGQYITGACPPSCTAARICSPGSFIRMRHSCTTPTTGAMPHHGLTARVAKRYAHGFAFDVNHTFSKTMDGGTFTTFVSTPKDLYARISNARIQIRTCGIGSWRISRLKRLRDRR